MGLRIAKHAARKTKREEASKRQAVRDTLTIDEQLQIISRRPGTSKRETKRLLTLKEQANAKSPNKGVHVGSQKH